MGMRSLNKGLIGLMVCLYFMGCRHKPNEGVSDSNAKALSCFDRYAGADRMMFLTKEEIAEYSPFPMEEALLKNETGPRHPAGHQSYYFQWMGNDNRERRIVVSGMDQGPKRYELGIRKVQFIHEEYVNPKRIFTKNYQAEIEKIRKAGEKDSVNVEEEPIEIQGLGDAAIWMPQQDALAVLKSKMIFEVLVDIDDEQEKNINLAKEIARHILRKCD